MNEDIRWKQRFSNYLKAFISLKNAVELSQTRKLTNLEEQGLIQSFEFTHELAWNVMKDYFEYQGNTEITGSRDAIREAFNKGLVNEGDSWMDTIKSRNRASHTYNEETASEIADKIKNKYLTLFLDFEEKMKHISQNK